MAAETIVSRTIGHSVTFTLLLLFLGYFQSGLCNLLQGVPVGTDTPAADPLWGLEQSPPPPGGLQQNDLLQRQEAVSFDTPVVRVTPPGGMRLVEQEEGASDAGRGDADQLEVTSTQHEDTMEELVRGCSNACSNKILQSWSWERLNRCDNPDDCYACWGFCNILRNENNRELLCKLERCGTGCRAACNYVYGISDDDVDIDLGYLACVLVFVACTSSILLLIVYLLFLLRSRRREAAQRQVRLPERNETLSWQELQLLDVPLGDKSRSTNHFNSHKPIAHGLLRLLEDIRETNDYSPCPANSETTKTPLQDGYVEVNLNSEESDNSDISSKVPDYTSHLPAVITSLELPYSEKAALGHLGPFNRSSHALSLRY